MEQQVFFIKGRRIAADDPQLQAALAQVYETPERPRCMCVKGGVEMYVAKFAEYVIKRMPDTGQRHHLTCPSYEPEWGNSGLSELLGEAIIEHSPETTEVRVDFALSRVSGRCVPKGEGETPSEVCIPRRKLSLRGLLHLLWERAGFNRWYPAMADKRSWGVIRRHLLSAASDIQTKGMLLTERLFVPEPFNETQKREIAERRRRQLSLLHSPEEDAQYKMAIILGEFKQVEDSPAGRKIWIKHLPDCPLSVDAKAWARIERVFGPLFEARDADSEVRPRLLICAVIYAKRERVYQIDRATFMLVTANWIPVEGVHEFDLLDRLTEQRRRFLKPLRFDAPSAATFPNALLLDAGDSPVPLHVVSSFLTPKERTAKEQAIQRILDRPHWVWRTDEPFLALPPPARCIWE